MSEPRNADTHLNEQRRYMAIQRGIEQAMNEMVRDMQDLIDDDKINVVASDMEKHQIGNLLGVAIETDSVELVKNFVYYQVGRDTKGSSWRRNGFGPELVKRLDSLKTKADSIAGEVHRQLGLSTPGLQQIEEVWIQLVRQYLGQLHRYFYYKKEARRW